MLAVPVPVHAAEPGQPVAAVAPVADSEKEKLAELEARISAEPDNPEWRFRLGMAEMQRGKPRRAIGQFRRILVDHPEATRVRLELARAYFLANDHTNAERHFRLVRAAELPAAVANNVDRFLRSIRTERPWSFSASFALAPDSNINAATAAETIEMYGLPFNISQDGRKSSGIGLTGQVGGEWAPQISGALRQRIGASLSRREYSGSRFDDMTVTAYTGPRINLGNVTLAGAVTGSRRWFGGTGFNNSVGAQAEISLTPTARTTYSLQGSAGRLRHDTATYLDGPIYGLTAGITRALDRRSLGNFRVSATRHEARYDAFTQTSLSAGAIYLRELPGGFSVTAQPGITYSRFDGVFLAFGRARRDTGYSLALSVLNRKLAIGRFAPRVGITRTINNSNIALYTFARTRFDMGITTIF